MIQQNLGKLQKVKLRDVWASEASDFTPWLANDENIQILGDTIAVALELEAQEKTVGPFRADILCKDTDNGSWVLIENQLERTNHLHLGQLLTYAAGLHAVTIVWIAETFTDEHRATLDWLNEITDDSFRFFGLEIELWRIDDSLAAPKFNMVSKPNDWSRSVTQSVRRIREDSLSELERMQFRYWTALKAAFEQRNSFVKSHKPSPQNWTTYSIGRSNFSLWASINSGNNIRLGVELIIRGPDAKPFYHLLNQEREEVEQSIGQTLKWMELPEQESSKVALYRDGCALAEETKWPSEHEWFIETVEKFDEAFRNRLVALNASDWDVQQKENYEAEG